ncbi:MAG: toll/interleukin-1 receptor domain-containing protein [Rhodoferax sp.]|nr:toll/interleukin-1 receptor domain-containing protein [Rhodoferax sp.]
MATKVFISWSGALSQRLAEALRNWLPSALQFVKPYFSPDDIEKGTKWSSEISKELETSNIGIICLTRDNTEKPWILFEAGALSKSLEKSRVCTLLFDVEPADVKGPLTSFQGTRFAREDFKRLFVGINSVAAENRLDPAVLDTVFDMWWPKLEQAVEAILKAGDKGSKKERRTERDILEELLELSRMNAARITRPRVSERAVMEMVEALDELHFILRHENGEIGLQVLKRIERPLRHICMEAGVPEAYEKFRHRFMESTSQLSLSQILRDKLEVDAVQQKNVAKKSPS